MYSYLLPIGSVVRLSGTDNLVMIYGVRQTAKAEDGSAKSVDYLAVPYPEGLINEILRFAFNHQDIEETVFTGYESETRQVFLQFLTAVEESRMADSEQ